MSVIVVKLGGSLLEDAALRNSALDAIAARWSRRQPLVLVHGGGKHIDAALQAAGIPKQTAGGLRVTDEKTLPIVISVLAGTVNKSLASELAAKEVPTLGLSGADGAILEADFHPPIDGIDLHYVGRIRSARAEILESILDQGFLPVIASLALGPGGTILNVNADSAAAAIAVALGASRLVFLTDVEGVLDQAQNVVPLLDAHQARSLLGSEVIRGGMRPKLTAAIQAIHQGLQEVVIAGPSTHTTALAGGTGGTQLVAA